MFGFNRSTPKGLDTILGAFRKTIGDLHNLESGNTEQAADIESQIESMEEHRQALLSEAEKATKVRHNLERLCGELNVAEAV